MQGYYLYFSVIKFEILPVLQYEYGRDISKETKDSAAKNPPSTEVILQQGVDLRHDSAIYQALVYCSSKCLQTMPIPAQSFHIFPFKGQCFIGVFSIRMREVQRYRITCHVHISHYILTPTFRNTCEEDLCCISATTIPQLYAPTILSKPQIARYDSALSAIYPELVHCSILQQSVIA